MGKCEINGSSGASRVYIFGWQVSGQEPDAIASTKCKTDVFFGWGNLEHLTTFGPTTDGGLAMFSRVLQCDASTLPVYVDGTQSKDVLLNLREQYIPVPKSNDGKFYFTVGVKGTSNGTGNKKYVYARVFAIVVK
jgi:hypothetical protein